MELEQMDSRRVGVVDLLGLTVVFFDGLVATGCSDGKGHREKLEEEHGCDGDRR